MGKTDTRRNRRKRRLSIAVDRCAWGMCLALLASFANANDSRSFRREVAPILLDNCIACHCARKAEGGYRLDAFIEMSKAGDSGIAPLEKGQGGVAELVRRLITTDESERMPAESQPLSDRQIEIITNWIESGASFDGENPADLLPLVIPPPKHPTPPVSYPSPQQVTAIEFAPGGAKILTSGYHEVLVWSLEGALEQRVQNIGQQTFAMKFSADGTQLAVACGQPGREGEVRLVDMATGEVKAILARCDDVVLDLAFRPDGKELAIAAADKTIRLVDTENLEVTRTLASHADWVTAITWSPDGKRLVSASRDQSAKVFDAGAGQLLVSYQGHGAPVRGVSVSSDGTQVLSSGSDNKLHRWNIETAKKLAEVGLGGEGYKVVTSSDWVLVPTANRTLLKIDSIKNNVMKVFDGHADWVLSAATNADRSLIATGAYDGEVRLWNAEDGVLVRSWVARP